jgi:Holliday junction resolvase RusA-like endonuclease
MIDLFLRCVPPSVTAQQKRMDFRGGKPVFFHGDRMRREEQTWAALLSPHRPPAPLDGPLTLHVRLVYPHLAGTAKKRRAAFIPKETRPDAGNAAKHLEDLLTKMRFVVDDARFAIATFEKWHGPEESVGIYLRIAPIGAGEQPCL